MNCDAWAIQIGSIECYSRYRSIRRRIIRGTGGQLIDQYESRERDDVLLYESPSGLIDIVQPVPVAAAPATPSLVLYVISLFGVHNQTGERIDGDALIVRSPDQPERALLAAVLGCTEPGLQALLDQGGTWAIRQIKSIDGYNLRFEPN